jgi:hypothetical protein
MADAEPLTPLANLESRVMLNFFIARAILQRLADASPDRRTFATELFSNMSQFLDELRTPELSGYPAMLAAATQRRLEEFSATLGRDLGLLPALPAPPPPRRPRPRPRGPMPR